MEFVLRKALVSVLFASLLSGCSGSESDAEQESTVNGSAYHSIAELMDAIQEISGVRATSEYVSARMEHALRRDPASLTNLSIETFRYAFPTLEKTLQDSDERCENDMPAPYQSRTDIALCKIAARQNLLMRLEDLANSLSTSAEIVSIKFDSGFSYQNGSAEYQSDLFDAAERQGKRNVLLAAFGVLTDDLEHRQELAAPFVDIVKAMCAEVGARADVQLPDYAFWACQYTTINASFLRLFLERQQLEKETLLTL